MRQIAEEMSFSELQAQEQAMARYQAQNARRASRAEPNVTQAAAKQQQTSKKAPLARNEPAVRTKTKQVATNRSSNDTRARQPVTAQVQTQTARKTMGLPLKRRHSNGSDEEEEAMGEDTSLGTEAAERGASRRLNLKGAGERPSTSARPIATTPSGKRQLDAHRTPVSGAQKSSKTMRSVAKKQHASSSEEEQEDIDDDEEESKSGADESTLVREKAKKGQGGRRRKLDTEKDRPLGQTGGLSTPALSAKHHQAQTPPTSRVGTATIHVAPGAPLHGRNEMQLITEGMSFSELQAQQQEFMRYHKQKRRELSGASSTLRKGERSTQLQNGNGGRRQARMGVPPKPDQAPSSPSPMFVAPPSRNGFLAPLLEPKLSTSSTMDAGGASASTEAPAKPTIPVIHSTAWRRLVFTEAPSNVLDVSVIPYALSESALAKRVYVAFV
ncbi:hypothetical protein BBJ28_00023411 [Nothophytophthora sp. Chile5]|nr:hypothetical protein BBJ28_00023411 [Nothophytophthora sp. Chile5]